MESKQRSIILVCYQIENNMRLWRFVKQAATNPGISSGNKNLDVFLFSWYEHGSISDDLLDNNIYLSYRDKDNRPDFGPVAILTMDDIFNGNYFNSFVSGYGESADSLEKFFAKCPGYIRGLEISKLNKLITDIFAINGCFGPDPSYQIKEPLPNEEWVGRSILLSRAYETNYYYQENYKPVLSEDRRALICLQTMD